MYLNKVGMYLKNEYKANKIRIEEQQKYGTRATKRKPKNLRKTAIENTPKKKEKTKLAAPCGKL